jgi:hypothetical protein
VPSRAAARLLPRGLVDLAALVPPGAEPVRRDDLLALLLDPDSEAEAVRSDAVPLDQLSAALERAVARATEWARTELEADVARARARLEKDREAARARLELRRARATAAEREGLEREEAEELAHFERVSEALDAARIELDSAAGFLLG